MFEQQLESDTVLLNRLLYEEGIGLPVDEHDLDARSEALARLYTQLLDRAEDPGLRYFALESWSEARRAPLDYRLNEERDRRLSLPDFHCAEGPLTWRNWKAFEREADDPARLNQAFERMVEQSGMLIPALEERLARTRADFATQGTTPAHTFAWREGATPEALRAFLLRVGQACRTPFQAALNALSQSVFGREAGPAELRALYLNRMYEPGSRFFIATAGEKNKEMEKEAVHLVRETQRAFSAMGFDLSSVPVDLENRPRKYPGASCCAWPRHITWWICSTTNLVTPRISPASARACHLSSVTGFIRGRTKPFRLCSRRSFTSRNSCAPNSVLAARPCGGWGSLGVSRSC